MNMDGFVSDVSLTATECISKALWPLSSMSRPRVDVAHFITSVVSPQLQVTTPISKKKKKKE